MLRIILYCTGLFIALVFGGCDRALTVDLLLADAAGLKAGNAVVYQGFEVGRVSDLRLVPRPGAPGGVARARLSLDPEHPGLLYREMDFVVEGRSLLGFGPEKQVVIHDTPTAHPTPLADGDVLPGRAYLNHIAGEISERLAEAAGSAGQGLGEGLDQALSRVEDLRDHSAVDELERWLDELTPSP